MKHGCAADPPTRTPVDSEIADRWRILIEEVNGRRTIGSPGARDPEFPCDAYEPGEPSGDCEADGHYLCRGCVRLDVAAWDALKGPPEPENFQVFRIETGEGSSR